MTEIKAANATYYWTCLTFRSQQTDNKICFLAWSLCLAKITKLSQKVKIKMNNRDSTNVISKIEKNQLRLSVTYGCWA